MKTKKTVIAVLIVAVLISTVLIIGCIEPLDKISASQSAGEDDNFVIPAGKGVVRFKIANGDARTIMPDNSASGLQVTAMYFDIMFDDGSTTSYYPVGSAGNPPATKLIHSSINNQAVSLDPGDYHVVITAYNNASGTIPIAGWTSTADITITAGVSASPQTVNLTGFVNGTANGTFQYNITIPNNIDYVPTLYIKGSGNVAAAAVNRSIVLAENNVYTDVPETLPSGYYEVRLKLEKQHYRTENYIYALHIYPAMTSKMPALVVSTTDLIENEFAITFDIGSEPLDNDDKFDDPIYFGYANFITNAANPLYETPVPSSSSMGFGGWYKNSLLTIPWNLSTDRVTVAQTLYADYVPAGSPGSNPFNITFTYTDEAGTQTVSADPAPTISRGGFVSGALGSSIDISLSGGPWELVEWSVDGVLDTVVDLHTTSNVLHINNSLDFAPALVGNFYVHVRSVKKSGDTAPYTPTNNKVLITVTP